MKYPDYCDPRAHHLFISAFVGSSHGDDGTSYKTMFDTSRAGVSPTEMYCVGYAAFHCVYCGNKGFPLQPYIPQGDYSVKGHTCVCKSSMDSLEVQAKLEEAEIQYRVLVRKLEAEVPKPSKEVEDKMLELIVTTHRTAVLEKFGKVSR